MSIFTEPIHTFRIDRPAERFRILNGLDQHAQVKTRDRVKIVVD